MHEALIGLGSNLGDRLGHIHDAIRELMALGTLARVSAIYETEPVGFKDQDPFLNAAAAVHTALPPNALMQALLNIEISHGRIRAHRNGPRTLDLDLLLYGNLILHQPGLTIPHPRLHLRRFVLTPLADIAPGFLHPVLQSTLSALLAALDDTASVALYAPGPHHS